MLVTRNLFTLVIFSSMLFLASCNKDSDSTEPEEKDTRVEVAGDFGTVKYIKLVGNSSKTDLSGTGGKITLKKKSGDTYTFKFSDVTFTNSGVKWKVATEDAKGDIKQIEETDNYEITSFSGNFTTKQSFTSTIDVSSFSSLGTDQITITLPDADFKTVLVHNVDGISYKEKKYSGVVYKGENDKPTLEVSLQLDTTVLLGTSDDDLNKVVDGITDNVVKNKVKTMLSSPTLGGSLKTALKKRILDFEEESRKTITLDLKFER